MPLRVLIVEDSEDDALLLLRQIRRGGYGPASKRVETGSDLRAALTDESWDLVIADYALPHFNAVDALKIVQDCRIDLPFLIVSGAIGEDVAVAAMRAGAHDYIMKGNLARLVPAMERELREAEVRRERRRAEEAQREEAAISVALARVGQCLISSLSTPVLLERLCRATTEVLECDWSYTFMWRERDEIYVLASEYGDSPEEREAMRVVEIPEALLESLLRRLESDQVVHLAPGGAFDPGAQDLLLGRRGGASVCVALRYQGRISGIHVAGSRNRSQPFSRRHERVTRGIGQLGSLALGNARLFEELDRANALKSDFVATMSHELRTPLHIIMGYNELLREMTFGVLTDEQDDALQRIDENARQLLALIEATLDVSRLETGRMQLKVVWVRLPELVRELKSCCDNVPAPENVELIWDVPADLPPVKTDAVKLKVVLKNLVDNALKFCERGRVTVSAAVVRGGIEVRVRDTGPGITEEAMPVIFDPFRQGDSSTTRRHGGVGLGLYIVRRMLDMLAGEIWVESGVDHGSTFSVWLPIDIDAVGTRTPQ